MIGLGLAIDFSLIVVSRFREELARRGDTESALRMTMATAGRSIVYSGVTVMLGMLVLSVLVDLMVIRSISLGVLIVAATSLLAGLTLLPAVLGILGPRIERRRSADARRLETEGLWYRWSQTIMRRPWAWLGGSIAVIVILALPALNLKMSGASPKLLPQSTESVKGTNIIDKQFGKNQLDPIQIVLKTPREGGVFTPQFLTGLDTLQNALQADRRADSVTSLASYMAAEPRFDGRYKRLKQNHDFWPAPDLSHATESSPTPGVHLTRYISVWVPKVPSSPAYFGWGRFTFQPGTTTTLKVAQTLQVYRILDGQLTVTSGGPTTLWPKVEFGNRHDGRTIPAGQPVTLQPRNKLVVPPMTPVTLHVAGTQPVNMIVAVIFHVRPAPGGGIQDSWLGSSARPTDPFEGIPRQVAGGGLGYTFPRDETHIILDLSDTKPGAVFPRHMHPGPELISDSGGKLTVFSSPEMVITRTNTPDEEGPYDTPTPLAPGSFAVVQGYGIHRAINEGKTNAEVWSLRVLDANKPSTTSSHCATSRRSSST